MVFFLQFDALQEAHHQPYRFESGYNFVWNCFHLPKKWLKFCLCVWAISAGLP